MLQIYLPFTDRSRGEVNWALSVKPLTAQLFGLHGLGGGRDEH